MQSVFPISDLHVAIVMDGNGRWATRCGLPRTQGHRAGIEALRRAIEAAPSLGVRTLTVFAFSSDNWRRPREEVDALMELLAGYLGRDAPRLVRSGVRLSVIGRRDRLPLGLAEAINAAEQLTAAGGKLHLRVAVDYSGRDAIVAAAAELVTGRSLTQEIFAGALASVVSKAPDVDLFIRTGGERRLSDFLLWESAYAELLFLDLPWPDFGPDDLAAAVADFARRERRFGGLPGMAAEGTFTHAA